LMLAELHMREMEHAAERARLLAQAHSAQPRPLPWHAALLRRLHAWWPAPRVATPLRARHADPSEV
jgi:hypothetical protein